MTTKAEYGEKIKNLKKLTHELLIELDREDLVGRETGILELINNAHTRLSEAVTLVEQLEKANALKVPIAPPRINPAPKVVEPPVVPVVEAKTSTTKKVK